jgi:hypothetical protein
MKYRFRIHYTFKERIFIVFIALIFITFIYFIIAKSIEKPNIKIVKSYEYGNLYIFVFQNVSAILEIERYDIIKIEYPFFKPSEICLNYDFLFDKNGNRLNKCFQTSYEIVIGKEVIRVRANDLAGLYNKKIFIRNMFNFSLNLEIIAKLNFSRNIYRNNMLIYSNVSEFYDNFIIPPYEILEYKIE